MAAVGVYALVAPNLGLINSEIGGLDASISWAAIVYTLMFGIGSMFPPLIDPPQFAERVLG